ncbi:serine/threonine kinase, putative [Entamoeba histolytica HM-3:IMSS]|uniref:Serine/threonine kinase, putative n=2 Tax=Entamoeba histolytica TaxID=5759 RepID=M2RXK5_ENTHI|nr:serine/threonine kinase, putative [Entamoeba histolytica KU27]EMS12084.1 serine/threonine kinase, putative [Entamoeba histolytica HM-3:IMSS]
MKYSNIQFIELSPNSPLLINKKNITFDCENVFLPVGSETKDIICVGNNGKNEIKVQFTSKEQNDKFLLRVQPPLVALEGGYACEFEIFIQPLCTCKIEEKLSVIGFDMKEGKEIIETVTIKTETEMTTKIDPDELVQEKKIGEGTFGIVYLGIFRGNKVAIKRMKDIQDDEDALIEFEKEIFMLDKFRCDYIIHFYGAVFIPNKICMVTEYAEFGSLQDMMKKEKNIQIRLFMKIKILIDAAKGISYLHSNGILHRDIKPDNILVLSIDESSKVNGKLTDFGSSRNINMMMTNMTFTKGIGTPTYMAPEILQQQKYKKTADIYSFGITMYETFHWGECYPKLLFKFPWAIADFINKGQRRERPDNIPEPIYKLITLCWAQEPKERLPIDSIIEKLESFLQSC